MTLIAGIDEAGYGPKLGPLVVSATAFWSDWPQRPRDTEKAKKADNDKEAPPDLWQALSPSVVRAPQRNNDGVVVGDSKRLYSRSIGLKHLETAALAFLGAMGKRVESRKALLAAVSLGDVAESSLCPWHSGADLGLPLEVEPLVAKYKAARLKAQIARAGLRFCGVKSRVVSAREFNASVRRSGNKARSLFESVSALLKWIAGCAAGGRFAAHVDKLGGRDRYGALLAEVFPAARIEVIEEGRHLSRYGLSGDNLDGVVSFEESSEQKHLPVALASMYSKYLRELDLRLFNRFWQRRVPGLEPTAGYAVDAIRFLSLVRPAMLAEGLDPDVVVRIK